MKPSSGSLQLLAIVGACAAFSAILVAQTPAPAPAAAGGGAAFAGPAGTPGISQPMVSYYRGTSRGAAFDDMTLTGITRMEEAFEKEMAAVIPAWEALQKATFLFPRNDAEIKAKLDALMNAELALAQKRSVAFQDFQKTNKLTAAQLSALINQVASGTIGVIPRGAPAPAAALAPAAPARGN